MTDGIIDTRAKIVSHTLAHYRIGVCTRSAVAAQFCAPQNVYRAPPNDDLYKKVCATSRDRMASKPKYPNCRHNFGRTSPVARF